MKKNKLNIFDEMDKIKSQIKDRVLSNQNLLKYIYYGDDDPLSEKDIEDLSLVVDKYVFFKPKMLDTLKEQKAYLTLTTSGSPDYSGERITNVTFTFNILTHLEIYDLADGSTRAWRICKELSDLFTDTNGSWIGNCEMEDFYEVAEVSNEYYCIVLKFVMSDFTY